MPRSRKEEAGFTLVEVLVALAVVAIALGALWKGLSQGIAVSQELPDRVMARWVAQNRLALREIRRDWPDTRIYEGSARMDGRTWYWREEISGTREPRLRRVSVHVGPSEEKRDLVTLEGFLREPVARRPGAS